MMGFLRLAPSWLGPEREHDWEDRRHVGNDALMDVDVGGIWV